jgi:hypothetical protein
MPGKKEYVKFGAAWVAYNRSGERFRWLGFSEGGVGFTYETESSDMMVDQTTSPIRTIITGETLTVGFPAVEATLDNFALAFPGAKKVGDSLHIFAASSARPEATMGTVLVHMVDRGNPSGDYFDPTETGYDPTDDILFEASLVGSLDVTYEREGMLHIPLTFKGNPDPMGRLAVIGNPFDNPFTFANYALTGTTGVPVTQVLAPTSGTAPYTYAIPQSSLFSLNGNTLTFNSDNEGTFATLVYAKDSSPAEVTGEQPGKIATAYVEVEVS